MAGQRKDIMELRTLILLKDKGLSNRKVAQMMNINRKTVNSYMQRFNALDLQYGELLSMDDSKLYDLFTEEDQTEKERYEILSSEFTKIQDELKRPGACSISRWWIQRAEELKRSLIFNGCAISLCLTMTCLMTE